jgi:hypothetical protein
MHIGVLLSDSVIHDPENLTLQFDVWTKRISQNFSESSVEKKELQPKCQPCHHDGTSWGNFGVLRVTGKR